jgi:hypothetical protein
MLCVRTDQVIRLVIIGLVETVAAVCRYGEVFGHTPGQLSTHPENSRNHIEPRNQIDPRDQIDPGDEISELVDWQLGGGEQKQTNRLRKCPNCTEQWHGLALTQRMQKMRRQGYFDETYRYCDDDSPVICPGSPPEHAVTASRSVLSPQPTNRCTKAGSTPHLRSCRVRASSDGLGAAAGVAVALGALTDSD